MLTKFISLKRLSYDDSAWRVEISASNGCFSGQQEFYIYSENLDTLSSRFCQFPQNVEEEARFELGERTVKWAYYVLIRAFLYNLVGHSAIEVTFDNNAESPNHAQAHFFIHCEVSAINKLGKQLQAWVISPDIPLIWSPDTV
jgi:hypothetical protein